MMREILLAGITAGAALLAATSSGADWPQWGRTADRNMISPETGLPDLRAPAGEDTTYFTSEENPCVKWKVRLGMTTWGNPTATGGRVFVGTSGPNREGGAIKCFDAATGDLVWQLICPARKFPTPLRPEKYEQYSPWDYLVATHAQTLGWGVCSSTTVDGDQAYALTQRGEVVCLDVHGLANGNQGPFLDEARYKAGDGLAPVALEATDADILWTYDIWTEVMSRPADTFSNAALIHGDVLYISTCNGIERWPGWYGKPAAPPSPNAPNLIALDKRTGRLLATDAENIGTRMLHGQWSPPSLGEVNGKTLVFYGGGDGLCYAFEALKDVPQQPVKLRKVWSYDCNLPEYKGIGVDNYSLGDIDVVRQAPGDKEAIKRDLEKHRDADGRLLAMSEIVGSPVFHGNRVYVAIGRDPRHGPGRGALHCIDATGNGDISQSGRIWCYDQIDRTLSTPSVADGLVYIPDLTGPLHCLDADTGRCCWTFDTGNETWGSTLVADGKVYLVTKKSFHVLATGKEKKVLSSIRIGADCTPIVADGVVYVLLRGTLYALHQGAFSEATRPAVTDDRQPALQSPPAAPRNSSWPCWRGPNGNGFSLEVPRRLPPEKLLWSCQTAGECHAPISVGEGSVVVADHDGKRDYWRCFGTADGQPRWVHEYANAQEISYGAGPRAAPLIDRGKVFCLNASGELFCLRMADGGTLWKKHLAIDFGQKTPEWGYSASPLMMQGKLLVSPGGNGGPVAALDPETGSVLWTGAGQGLNYANLTIGVLGGVEQVVAYDQLTAGAWDPATGRRLWSMPVENAARYIVPSPVIVHGRLLLSSDQEGARLFSFDPGGAIAKEPAALNEDLAPDVSTPTVWGDTVLSASSGLVLTDASPADSKGLLKTLWVYDDEDCVRGVCHAIVSQDRALIMCEDGQALLLAANRQSCEILDRRKLCDHTLAYPALAGGRLYVRDSRKLYCYDMPVGP